MDNSSPVFIIGTPRSGTTLMAKILGRHSRLFMPGETHFMDDIYSHRKELGAIGENTTKLKIAEKLFDHYERYYELEDQKRISGMFKNPSELAGIFSEATSYGDAFDRFMKVQMRALGKSRWGNNAPRDLFNITDIISIFPSSKFIVCVRDIRGFLLSYKSKWKIVEGEQYVSRMKRLYHPVVTSLLWKSSMKQVNSLDQLIETSDFNIVHYENLVSDPENTVRKICIGIGEQYEPSMIEVDTHNSSTGSDDAGIFSTSIDRWKTRLSQEEIQIGQSIGLPELEKLGYQAVKTRANLVKVSLIWLQAPIALWRALEANKSVRGPLIPYMVRRLSVLIK